MDVCLDQQIPPKSQENQEVVLKKPVMKKKIEELKHALAEIQHRIGDLNQSYQQILGQIALLEDLDRNGMT